MSKPAVKLDVCKESTTMKTYSKSDHIIANQWKILFG